MRSATMKSRPFLFYLFLCFGSGARRGFTLRRRPFALDLKVCDDDVAAFIVLGTDAEQWDLGACRLNERRALAAANVNRRANRWIERNRSVDRIDSWRDRDRSAARRP